MQRRELSRIGVIGALEGLLCNAAQIRQLTVRMHGVACVGDIAPAVNCRLKHAVLGRIVVIDLLHKRDERPASVKLVVTERVVTIAVRKALVIVAVALILGKVLHLAGHIDKRDALDRPQHARERLLGIKALIDIGGIRGNARRGLIRSSGRGRGNGAKRKSQRQSGNNRRMLGLHKILLALV